MTKSMSAHEKDLLVYGYFLGQAFEQAQAAKDEGLFADLSIQDIAALYLRAYLEDTTKKEEKDNEQGRYGVQSRLRGHPQKRHQQ